MLLLVEYIFWGLCPPLLAAEMWYKKKLKKTKSCLKRINSYCHFYQYHNKTIEHHDKTFKSISPTPNPVFLMQNPLTQPADS